MNMQKPTITPYELKELTNCCLRILTYTDDLRGDETLKKAYEEAKKAGKFHSEAENCLL